MASISIADRIEFIRGINISLPKGSGAAVYADGDEGPGASVAADSSVCFVANITGQMKADVLNSTLLAQLAATSTPINREEDTKAWYDVYKHTLETVGWVTEAFTFVEQNDADASGTVDKFVLKLAAAYLAEGEFELFQTMIESLKDAKNEAAMKIFNESSKSITKAGFQLGVASNAQGNASFKIGYYEYDAKQEIDTVLFFTFGNQEIEFSAGNQTMVLNTDVYSQVREQVLETLGQNAKNLIAGINLN